MYPAADTPTPSRRQARFYGWRLVLVGAFVLAIAGIESNAPHIARAFVGDPLSITDFDPASGVSIVHAVMWGTLTLLPALLLPFIGWAVDRWGARRAVLWGFVLVGVGFMLLVGWDFTAIYYLSVTVLLIGGVVASELPMAAAVNNWFQRRRATAMGIMMLPSIAAIVLLPVVGVALGSLASADWTAACLAGAALMLALTWPVYKLVRNRPEDYGQLPDGREPQAVEDATPGKSPDIDTAPDYRWREALRTRAFWMITLGVGVTASAASQVNIFFIPLSLERGFPHVQLALWTIVRGAVSLVFVVVGGWLGDRIPIRWAMFVFSLLQAASVGVLLFADDSPMLLLSAALMGVGDGGMVPLTLAVRGAYFGRRDFATITGISMMFIAVLTGLLPTLSLVSVFSFGFADVMAASSALAAVGSFTFLFIGNPRRSPSQNRERKMRKSVA